jgi:hypothetical protein
MTTVEVENLAGLNDTGKLLLYELAVLNRKMRESRLGPVAAGLKFSIKMSLLRSWSLSGVAEL